MRAFRMETSMLGLSKREALIVLTIIIVGSALATWAYLAVR
jgi:hypothetical protein